MKIIFTENYLEALRKQTKYIATDKPKAALKFKKDLISILKKDLNYPFHYKKSYYFADENKRDYVFKGYTSIFEVDSDQQIVTVFAFIKYMENL